MLPLFKREFIESGLISEETFYNIIAISEMTPGSFAVNAATFIGNEKSGILGALISTIAVSLPSLIILVTLMGIIKKYENSKVKDRVFKGLRPAVFGFILSALFMLVGPSLTDWTSLILYGLSLAMIYSKKIHPILVIFLMGLVRMVL